MHRIYTMNSLQGKTAFDIISWIRRADSICYNKLARIA